MCGVSCVQGCGECGKGPEAACQGGGVLGCWMGPLGINLGRWLGFIDTNFCPGCFFCWEQLGETSPHPLRVSERGQRAKCPLNPCSCQYFSLA